MKKLLLISSILFALAIYGSLQAINYISSPGVCAECHTGSLYSSSVKGSILPYHVNSSITCIDCHSQKGFKGHIEALETVAGAKIIKDMKPAINKLFQANFSFDGSFDTARFARMRANCEKCHPDKDLRGDFHIGNVTCGLCHFVHTKPRVNFEAAGVITHKNVKCAECHGTGTVIQIPSCTKCHTPHIKGAKWDNVLCLNCHNDAHVPTKSITFSESTPIEICQGCHALEFQNLTQNGGKHNLMSCVNCHPKHGSIPSCFGCHGIIAEDSAKHFPHKSNSCNLCHFRKIVCSTCHNPHSPFSGLPRQATNEQIGEIAQQRLQKLK